MHRRLLQCSYRFSKSRCFFNTNLRVRYFSFFPISTPLFLGRTTLHFSGAKAQIAVKTEMATTGFIKEYDDVQYWDRRYLDEGEDTFDWYQRYKELEPLLFRYINKNSRLLMAGCGNAVLSEEMVLNGYKEIVNIDFSTVVIKMMQNRHRQIPQLTYVTLDVRDMSVFGDESFDAVIDKGLMDSMLCGSNGFLDVTIMLEEVLRVLKPGGVFMLVTYGEPLLRMHHLKNPAFDWKVVLHLSTKPGAKVVIPEEYSGAIPMDGEWECEYLCNLSDPDLNFVYICTKANPMDNGV